MSPPHSRAPERLRRGALAACLAAAAACVTPPSPEEVLAVGFRSPEQAFRSFQTAARMDDPSLELRCFSSGFRARHRASQLTWRLAREEIYERMPWMRAGIAKASIQSCTIDGAEARLEARAAGRDLLVRLVREDFAAAWSGGDRVLDREIDWAADTGVQQGADGRRWWFGRAALPEGVDPLAVTELCVGREWKIDDVTPIEKERSPRAARAQVRPQDD